jgi:hypothetical protein
MNLRTVQAARISDGRPRSTAARRVLVHPKRAMSTRAAGRLSRVRKLVTAMAIRLDGPAQRRGVISASNAAAGHMIHGKRCWRRWIVHELIGPTGYLKRGSRHA